MSLNVELGATPTIAANTQNLVRKEEFEAMSLTH